MAILKKVYEKEMLVSKQRQCNKCPKNLAFITFIKPENFNKWCTQER